MKKDKYEILEDFKLRKQSRTLSEATQLLSMFGFVQRRARKEHSAWTRGTVGLTLPTPHGQYLKVPYVRLVIRKIEEAELLAAEGMLA